MRKLFFYNIYILRKRVDQIVITPFSTIKIHDCIEMQSWIFIVSRCDLIIYQMQCRWFNALCLINSHAHYFVRHCFIFWRVTFAILNICSRHPRRRRLLKFMSAKTVLDFMADFLPFSSVFVFTQSRCQILFMYCLIVYNYYKNLDFFRSRIYIDCSVPIYVRITAIVM